MSIDKEYILDEIKDKYIINESSKFYRIYKVFDKPCNNSFHDRNVSCCPDSTNLGKISSKVTKILKDVYSNLYRIYASTQYTNNDYFDDVKNKDYILCYTSLKYWLYDKIIINELNVTEINEIFTGWENYIKDNISNKPTNPCLFNELTLDEIKRLKNIYALYTVLYDNNANFETCKGNKCKYLEYVGKGLDEMISSINSCSNNSNDTNYCIEFKEFVNLCKEENEDAGISIYFENTKSKAEAAKKHLLSVQSYENEPHYIYIKNDNLLNYVKTSDFLSNKTTTIAATSVVGSAIGLSSIFYYFYKVIHNNIFKYKCCTTINIKYVDKILL
ncbi:hypothetical protein PVNG_04458 [Plasmodium vivax North Korean]|uniref:Variable surface protein n=1 Tax=Plasmodium vivax North Korean TaxID=1035514 RepID=A0A0J9U2G3_PLAVI|nr:hypothetical protein PVNG_04458 [Plasmodium vivax North Korean]